MMKNVRNAGSSKSRKSRRAVKIVKAKNYYDNCKFGSSTNIEHVDNYYSGPVYINDESFKKSVRQSAPTVEQQALQDKVVERDVDIDKLHAAEYIRLHAKDENKLNAFFARLKVCSTTRDAATEVFESIIKGCNVDPQTVIQEEFIESILSLCTYGGEKGIGRSVPSLRRNINNVIRDEREKQKKLESGER